MSFVSCLQADLNSLTHQKLHLTGVLQHQQARQADALQAAVGALDQCLSPEEAGTGSSEPNEGHSIKQGSEVPESGPHVKRIVINEVRHIPLPLAQSNKLLSKSHVSFHL